MSQPKWTMKGSQLKVTDTFSYLGAVLVNGGSAEHVNQRIRAAKNAHRSLQAAGIHANGLDPLAAIHVYSLGVQPCLNYGAHAIHLSSTELRALDMTNSNLIYISLSLSLSLSRSLALSLSRSLALSLSRSLALSLSRSLALSLSHIKKSLDHGKIVCAILMDLSKGFDCISHKLLIAKFRSYGLSMSACHLLTSYLRDRTQRVKLGNTKSKWLHIDKGSAQGSILGPFCYNVFTNDMLSIVSDNIEIYNYADDNTVICSGYEYEDIKAELMLNVDKIIDWFRDNHMKVNPDKFQCIVFGNVVNPGTFIINGNIVRPEETVKLLGVHIDNKLDFGHHVSHICQKAGKQVKVLSRLSRVLNESNKLLLYSSFISCYFNYCCVLWHFCNNSSHLLTYPPLHCVVCRLGS